MSLVKEIVESAVAQAKMISKRAKTLPEAKETASYQKLFDMGHETGYVAGKSDCLNGKEEVTVFTNENRDLNDGYTVGFEVGYLRAISEYYTL